MSLRELKRFTLLKSAFLAVMKKFSLKKKTQDAPKKLGGFSLKKKGVGSDKEAKSTVGNSSSIFGDAPPLVQESSDVAISSLDEVSSGTNLPLVITPVVDANSWEHRRAEAKKKRFVDAGEAKPIGDGEEKAEHDDTVSLEEKDVVLRQRNAVSLDYNSYPDPPTEETYKRVPVKDFGMAMLRGMGWTPEYEREKVKNARQYQ